MYGNTYLSLLNKETKEEDYDKFTYAMAEQIAETFVAYQLGIISNHEGWTNFKAESFANIDQLEKFIKKDSQSANRKWVLMDKLYRAQFIKEDE